MMAGEGHMGAGQTGECPEHPEGGKFVLDGTFLPVAFRTQSSQVARDIIQYLCRREDADLPPNRVCQIMRNLVDDTLRKRLDMMKSLASTLDLQQREQLQLLNDVATQMFDDQVVTWGRIVTLFAFCAYLARYCEEGPFPDCADDIGKILSDIVVNRLGLWIVTNGGWKAFEHQFPTLFSFNTTGVWKGVVIMALLIGGVIAFYSSMRFMTSNT